MKNFFELLGSVLGLLLKIVFGIVGICAMLVVNMLFLSLTGALAGWLLDLIFSHPFSGLFALIGCPVGGFWLIGAVCGFIGGLFKFHIRFNQLKKQA